MSTQRFCRIASIATLIGLTAAPAYAHHEAMFGPQSSTVLSPTFFVPAQVFDKEAGKDNEKRRETTTVYSAGFTPLKNKPLSIAFVLPVTFAGGVSDPSTLVRRIAGLKIRF
jgi:hypothetical protein